MLLRYSLFILGLPAKKQHFNSGTDAWSLRNYLNSIRTNFSVCCQYPVLVMWRWQMRQCSNDCERLNRGPNGCCVHICNYQRINLIPNGINLNSQNFTYDPTAGLIYSFMLSVGNDTQWTETISDSTNYCTGVVSKQATFDSCGIPIHLYTIINCAYNELFFRCPPWNPSNLNACEYTKEYIDTCFRIWWKISNKKLKFVN